ncbi:NAD(P)/FAD-dependent oxidoreductase, partial [Acidobacteriota bacterium]
MGICTAYFLAKRGQKEVVILEKDLLAQASTGLCVGGIRQQFSNPANIQLSQETVRLFENFEEEFNQDIHFHQVGYLFLAKKEETWRAFRSSLKVQHQHHVPVELLPPEEIKHRWPYLEVSDLQGGTFGPKDG